jgi:[acyl-carrier-protein] S-malonyltransferase
MGQDLLSDYAELLAPLAQAANQLATPQGGEPLTQVMFEGPEATLKNTRYTQAGILTASLMALRAFEAESQGAFTPVAMAGHSLGEFSALVAAGVMEAPAALALVKQRAQLMEEAPQGTMAAVLGLSKAEVDSALATLSFTESAWAVVANDNAPGQVVLSGTAEGIELATPTLKAAGAKRVLPLPVSGAFHSKLMQAAADTFAQALALAPFQSASVPVVSNATAKASQEANALQQALTQQMPSAVLWTDTMNVLVNELGVNTVIEFGPNKVLAGLFKKTHPQVAVFNVMDTPSLHDTLSQLKALQAQPCSV